MPAKLFAVLFIAGLIMVIFALISCLSAEEDEVRGLPRILWVLIILLFPLLGSITYFVAGRPQRATGSIWRVGSGFPEYARPKRVLAPDDDPEFLKSIDTKTAREDAEFLRRWEDDLRRREAELRKREDTPPSPPKDATTPPKDAPTPPKDAS